MKKILALFLVLVLAIALIVITFVSTAPNHSNAGGSNCTQGTSCGTVLPSVGSLANGMPPPQEHVGWNS